MYPYTYACKCIYMYIRLYRSLPTGQRDHNRWAQMFACARVRVSLYVTVTQCDGARVKPNYRIVSISVVVVAVAVVVVVVVVVVVAQSAQTRRCWLQG